jgi:hypothetical protein
LATSFTSQSGFKSFASYPKNKIRPITSGSEEALKVTLIFPLPFSVLQLLSPLGQETGLPMTARISGRRKSLCRLLRPKNGRYQSGYGRDWFRMLPVSFKILYGLKRKVSLIINEKTIEIY